MSLKISSSIRDYEVRFEDSAGFLGELAGHPNVMPVIDENVWKLHQKDNLKGLAGIEKIILSIDEEKKTLETVQLLYDRIMEKSPKKNLALIVIGGGILQDIAGFAASTLYRGINWVFVPTTLLAQADSCIGAKTSLNYRGFKNLIGTFCPPGVIHVYTPFLKTLAEMDYYSGAGEIAKLHIMGGEKDVDDFIRSLPRINQRSNHIFN